MAFSIYATRVAYNENSIFVSAPAHGGVYGIFSFYGICLYVGSGENIRSRLLSHFRGHDPSDACIVSRSPNYCLCEQTPYRITREQELYDEFRPPCNSVRPG